MRFRTDSAHIAELKGLGKPFEQHSDWPTREEWDATPAAQPGDTWRITWWKEGGNGPLAGYAICCPKCRGVHRWTPATNCSTQRMRDHGFVACDHSGVGSCWIWQGSAEDNALTASPSLWWQAEKGGCGWHGWLQAGEMRSC